MKTKDKPKQKKIEKVKAKMQEILFSNENIVGFLYAAKNEKDLSSNKFELANSVLQLKNGEEFKPQFLNFLWVKQFLYTDTLSSKNSTVKIANSLTEKTEAIFSKFKLFFESNDVGAFFVVKDGRGGSHLVFDKDKSERDFIGELDPKKHKLIFDFMEGQNASFSEDEIDDNNAVKPKKSVVEYELIDEKWKDIYLTFPEVESDITFISGCNWVLMIRISDSTFKTLGLMGFYGNSELKDDLLAKQLLMLLRKDLGKFIKKHHQNDEFAALREAELTKRFAYLAGHGREMIQKLAYRDKDFASIVTTMGKLQYLFATNYLDNVNKEELLDTTFLKYGSVDSQTINKILEIGNKIYKSEFVENKVKVVITPIQNYSNIEFSWNPEILKFICFELLINAKKNRFHFIEDHFNCTCTNTLTIDFAIKEEKLQIKFSGTGTAIPPDVVEMINERRNIKPDKEISGLYLVFKVLELLGSNNALKVNETPEEICEKCHIHLNTVTLHLNPMVK